MPPSKKLIPLLNEISSYLNQLLNALLNEYDALSTNNIKLIENIAKEKIILMEQLEDLDKEKKILLEKSGLDISSSSIEEFISKSSSPRAPIMKNIWEKISTLTKECEKQNNINGIVIESNKKHTENALSILQGKQQDTELYSEKGTSIKTSNPQTMVRA